MNNTSAWEIWLTCNLPKDKKYRLDKKQQEEKKQLSKGKREITNYIKEINLCT